MYDLRVTLSYFEQALRRRQYDRLLAFGLDEDATFVREVVQELADLEMSPTAWAGELACYQRAYERFAQEVLGVSLADWLALQYEGAAVVAAATEVIELYTPESAADTDADDGEATARELVAEGLFEVLVEEWEAGIEGSVSL